MSLTLTITNVDQLDNGQSTRLVLDRHGAVIGRSAHADWSLPDPKKHLSSTHCEIEYRDGGYVLVDTSTNGTFLNGAAERMPGPHTLEEGDEIGIGHYRIRAQIAGAAPRKAEPVQTGGGWGAWGDAAPAAGTSSSSGWDSAPAAAPARAPVGAP
jgi:type VI secretion system protein ImpI/type VI secretion system protein